jgi:hypothetical protein
VALPSKEAFLYVFDRVTGQPVWPIEERPVPQSDIPGEKLSPTQPFPTKPPAYARNYLKVPDDLIDFTPELRAQALERLKKYKYEASPFMPPIVGNVNRAKLSALDGDEELSRRGLVGFFGDRARRSSLSPTVLEHAERFRDREPRGVRRALPTTDGRGRGLGVVGGGGRRLAVRVENLGDHIVQQLFFARHAQQIFVWRDP